MTRYAAHYERERVQKQADRRLYLILDLLVDRLTVERDIWRQEGHEEKAQGLDRAVEVLTISRDAHAVEAG